MTYSSELFDLKNWKLTLPVDSGNGISGTAVEIKNLINYENSKSFFSDGTSMTFRASADGATTSGSNYARSELREMKGADRAEWQLSEGGTMTATLRVDATTTTKDGLPGKIVVGQIHGQSDELIRLYWDNGKIYFKNDQAGSDNKEMLFNLTNAKGEQPSVSLNEQFSYKIDAHGDTLSVTVYADGQTYTSVSKINSVWQSDKFYFKAGAYLGVNETTGSGTAQVSFQGLDFGHTANSGLGGLTDHHASPTPTLPIPTVPTLPTIPTVPVTPPTHTGSDPVAGSSISGTDGHDRLSGTAAGETIYGRSGNDDIKGLGGNDTLWGNNGDDTLTGGAGDDWLKGGDGKDTYIFNKDHGHDVVNGARSADTLVLSTGSFASAEAAKAALSVGSDGVVFLKTGAGSDIKFTDATLSQVKSMQFVIGTDGASDNAGGSPVVTPTQPTSPVVEPPAVDTGKISSHLGTGSNDQLVGTAGVDRMYGKAGNDILLGGGGKDELWGNDGNDKLVGGAGDDWMKGGAGADTYVFSSGHGHDTIHEFRSGDTLLFDDIFGSMSEAKAALSTTDQGIYLHTGADSGVLFTGTTMAELQNANWLFDHA